MNRTDVQHLEKLLADFANADHEARRANAARARAHMAIIEFYAAHVPAGTSEADLLDIPPFLRASSET
jgi:hypothetical protein